MATAVAKTRRGSPPRERGEGAAPLRGAPERAEGHGGTQKDVVLLCCLSSLSSSSSSAAGLTWPERPSLRDTENVGQPGIAPAPRPCQGHTATVAQPERGHPRGNPSPDAGCPGVVPVSVQGLRVLVLLPARGERLSGARGQPCPSPWQPPARFPPGQPAPAPAPIQPVPPEIPEPVNEQHHEDDEEEDDDGREANEPRLQHLGARVYMARGQGRENMAMGTASGELCPSGDGTPHEMEHWQTLTVPPSHCPLGTKEATPDTAHLSPAQ